MLFWLFVIALVIGIVCIIIGKVIYDTTPHDTGWLIKVGVILTVLATIAVLISGVAIIDAHADADAYVAALHKRYESLTYQLENNVYDNDNDLGKKELYNQIQNWNEDLAYRQNIQNHFWLGVFYADIYGQFEFINLTEEQK